MKMKPKLIKAMADLLSLAPILVSVLLVVGSLWFLVESMREMVRELGQRVILVQPYYDVKMRTCGCQVSVIRQS